MSKNLKILLQRKDCEKTIQKWFKRAKENNESLKDETRSRDNVYLLLKIISCENIYIQTKRIHILDFDKILNKWQKCSKMPRFNKGE